MKRCKDASSIKQQRLFKRRWRRFGHKVITIIVVLSVSLCQCVPQQTRQRGNSTGVFNLQDYSYYYDTTGGQRDYSTGLGQFAEYTHQSQQENKPVGGAPQYENRDYWSSDHNGVTEGRIMNRGNKTYNQNSWQQGPTGEPSNDLTPAPKWSQVDHTDLSSAQQQVLPPEKKNEGNNANHDGMHFWYEDRWNQSYQYDQVTIAPKVYGYPEDDAIYHQNVSTYKQQPPIEQSWNYNGYYQGNAENGMQNPQNVWEQSEGQFEDNKNQIDDVFAQHIATIFEEDIPSGHNNNRGENQDVKQQYSQQHNQDGHIRQKQLKKHQAQQIYQHQIRLQGQNQQWAQIQPAKKQPLIGVLQNQQQDNQQWANMQLNQPENKQQSMREQQNQQQDKQKKIQLLLQAQQYQQQKWLKQQQQVGMGHQSQQQQLGIGLQNQQQQVGMGQQSQQQQVDMSKQNQQQQLGKDQQNQQQQVGMGKQNQQQQVGKDEQAKKDQLIQQILSHHYQKSREEMPQKPTMNDEKLNGRPKPTSFTRFPVRRPSKIWQWQMAIRNRFQNHIDKSKRRKESEERGNQIQPPEHGTSIVDSFAESAVMPGAFLAFCMLFMDILNRLMPFSFNSTPTTTTTTTRPPKIVKYEWTPPKIPTVVDMLEHMSDKFARLKAFKLKKKSKKKKWMASSEEDKWRGLPLEDKPKRKRKKGGKRTTKAPKLSLERLQELYQIYKPDYIKNNQLSYLL